MVRFTLRGWLVFVLLDGGLAICAEEVQPLETVQGWGLFVDPVGDCKFEHDAGNVTIKVPGAYHDLWPVNGQVNAPLVLQDAQGDFTLEVKVAHIDKAEPNTMISGLASTSSFHAGTLVIWQDAKNFIRFDRTDMNKGGRAITSCYLHVFKGGERVAEAAPIVPDKPTHLRLQRRSDRLTAAYSQDGGKSWRTISSPRVELQDKVKVGISALNNTSRENTVHFADLKITR